MSRFNVVFSLMSVIPLLTCCHLITVRFFSFSVLLGANGVYVLLALVIALLGLLAGYELIRDIIRQLVEANAKLAKLNDQQAGFVSNVAHEFRSPLAVFKGALDQLAQGHIQVESRVDDESRFLARLPISPPVGVVETAGEGS